MIGRSASKDRDALRARLAPPKTHEEILQRHTASFPRAMLRQSAEHLFAAVRPC